ncbi:hypothetical protein BCR33DRAFT_721326 [Rhizoclosmatium globosum]|uniref:Uncharacterized protein n=1 Tax=Rhizoclosmatium globosum TaxID=329046 RepID=A0A1Y2B259_9FUNG|nr:hypothetical protein BCR33DRAFT_725050 [Rhizoclosmatium globosum]ORY37578.1 hypothetical protein BCR33DRAFT_721326 [Rhizoclosmatium globosum]|eukprot:ORY28577.1 hypothetical protein BCR33DRAFT_725050 [Rhizoclosmatium globosum]
MATAHIFWRSNNTNLHNIPASYRMRNLMNFASFSQELQFLGLITLNETRTH